MFKFNKKIFVVIFTLLLSVTFSFVSVSNFALANNDILIHLKNDKEVRKNVELNIFKVNSEKSDLELLEQLRVLSKSELEEKYGTAKYVVKSNEEGKIQLKDLEDGTYYAVEFSVVNGEYVTVPFIFNVPTTEKTREIFVKVVEKKEIPENGGKRFTKISGEDNKPLQGASFKVMTKKDGAFVPVVKEGQNYIVTSDERGNFSVDNLAFGKYYLWEVNAPVGYSPLTENIEFEIVGNEISNESQSIAIKNWKTPPPPVIPNTGDITFFVLLLGGSILVILGYYMTREEKNI